MANVQLKSCFAEGALALSILDSLQEIGDLKKEMDGLIEAVPSDLTILEQGDDILERETAQAPTPVQNVSGQIGIPESTPTTQEEEERLELLNLIAIGGIIYLTGIENNIERFRQLFFAVGANLPRFKKALASVEPFVVVQTYLRVEALPTQIGGWTLSQAQAFFQNPAIESVYVAGDGVQYCVVPQFMGFDISAEQAARVNGVQTDQMLTQLFWLRDIQVNTGVINRLTTLGITGDQQTAVLSGQSLRTLRPSLLSQQKNVFGMAVQKNIGKIDLLSSRFPKLDSASIEVFRKEIYSDVQQTRRDGFEMNRIARFASVTILDPEEIGVFLSRNSDSDLSYLLSKRRTVLSINFKATEAQVRIAIQQSLTIPAGSETLSALAQNAPVVSLDPEIDLANQRQVFVECASRQLHVGFRYQKLLTARNCLARAIEVPPVVEIPPVPKLGYASYDSPASIIFRQADIYATLGWDRHIEDFEKAFAKETESVRIVCEATVRLLTETRVSIDQIFSKFRNETAVQVAKAEAFMSKYMAYHGTAVLDASILRCSFGYNLTAGLPILAEMDAYIRNAERVVRNALSKIIQAVQNFLQKVLCYPVNLINGFIKGVESNLPAFCDVYKIQLPEALTQSLMELRALCEIQVAISRGFTRDLFRVKAEFQAAPSRIASFKESLACDNEPNARFFQQAKTTLGTGFRIQSPIG